MSFKTPGLNYNLDNKSIQLKEAEAACLGNVKTENVGNANLAKKKRATTFLSGCWSRSFVGSCPIRSSISITAPAPGRAVKHLGFPRFPMQTLSIVLQLGVQVFHHGPETECGTHRKRGGPHEYTHKPLCARRSWWQFRKHCLASSSQSWHLVSRLEYS